jgi:hypothetical protein
MRLSLTTLAVVRFRARLDQVTRARKRRPVRVRATRHTEIPVSYRLATVQVHPGAGTNSPFADYRNSEPGAFTT